MAAVNQNMFDASITTDHRPRGASLMVLPLNLLGLIISHLDNTGDLARLCRTCRVLNYMSLPQLYRHITLTSYEKIRYHGDEPEGMGSASPFSMGLNAVITRPYSSLVRSLTLRGDWREHELEEHARVGRVPDSAMMLNIAVRAAVDRMTDLEGFSWELNTKMLETVYLGLAQLPKLTSLTVRFPSSRHPRPTIVIPPMPHLQSLKITDIDPLCYPDDISTLLWKSKKLRELKMHWSPRMRNAQEPSVMLHDYFRKCIAARQPMSVKKIALQNLYALHSEEFSLALDPRLVEELTVLNDGALEKYHLLNTFVDSSWPPTPPDKGFHIKTARQDHASKRHADFIGSFTGLEKLYFVSASRDPNDDINSPRHSAVSTLTPPSLDHTNSTLSGPAANNSPAPPSSTSPNFQASLRDSYLNNITVNHAATLRHLLLPSRWPLSASAIARLVHASPQLEQLAFATELSSMDTLGLLLPFLRKLVALRLLVPTGCTTPANGAPQTKKQGLGPCASVMAFYSARTLADLVELDDDILVEKFGEALADPQVFSQLTIIGLGRKAWQLGEYYTAPADSSREGNLESQPPTPTVGAEANGHQDNSPASLVNERSASQSEGSPLTPAPNPGTALAKPPTWKISQPPSLLGKRQRESDPSPRAPQDHWDDATQFQEKAYPFPHSMKDGRVWRRRVRRVGWEVLQHWEIWGLDTQEI